MGKYSDPKTAIEKMIGCGMTHGEIADETGLDRATLWRIEEGKHKPRKVTRNALERAAQKAAKNRRKSVREARA